MILYAPDKYLDPPLHTVADICLQSASIVGKLDIVWRTSFGERGRLQTSQLTRVVSDNPHSVIGGHDAHRCERTFGFHTRIISFFF